MREARLATFDGEPSPNDLSTALGNLDLLFGISASMGTNQRRWNPEWSGTVQGIRFLCGWHRIPAWYPE